MRPLFKVLQLLILLLTGLCLSLPLFADYSTPPALPNVATLPGSPTASTGQATPGTSAGEFGQMVQQSTANGLKTFQNVTYQKLSEAQDQQAFSDDSTPPQSLQLFTEETP